jgi:hypothetical protein
LVIANDNPWDLIKPLFHPPQHLENVYGEYRSPLRFQDGRVVTNAEQWQQRREEILSDWQQMMGPWPASIDSFDLRYIESAERENFTQHKVEFAWTPKERTTGYLLIPAGAVNAPAVVTVYYEPETAIGMGAEHRDFALQLARRGFVALSIGTTEATEAKTFSLYYPDIDRAEVQPLSMLGYAASSARRLLATMPEVDPQRIGIVGHSFGGKWSMFAACLDDQFACAVWSDPGIVFDAQRPSVNYWEPWYLGYHPKPWRVRGLITSENPARGLYPRLVAENHDLHELHALMAPRPFLVSGGSEDPVERWIPLNHTRKINRMLGYEDRVAMSNRPQHTPDPESNAIIYAFFQHFLQNQPQSLVQPKTD